MVQKAISSWFLKTLLAMTVGAMLLGVRPLYAQVDTGTILGTVTDASGAVIHGANVTLKNEGTNATLSTSTGSDGTYKFSPVRIGSYKLSASLQGFQTVTQLGVTVNVGADVVVDFTLKPGNVTQTVEISDDLSSWVGGSSYSAANSIPNTPLTSEVSRSGTNTESIIVRENLPLTSAPQSFMRVRVSSP